jgi:hypothetical protein
VRRSIFFLLRRLPVQLAAANLYNGNALMPGQIFSTILSKLWGSKEYRILILGLDGAGKTTILYRMQVPLLLNRPGSAVFICRQNAPSDCRFP